MPKSLDEAWARVRALRPLIIAHRAEAESLKHLPPAVARAFLDSDFYRFVVPEDLGGGGFDPLTYFDLCEEIASYDGSTGWNFALASTNAPLLGSLPGERLRAIFAGPDCGIAGTVMPTGRAFAVEGGWRVSGRWRWMSGVHQAKWVILGTTVHDAAGPVRNADGAPQSRQFLLPKDECHILDVWDVGGMRGTGSTDYACSDAFVPENMALRVFSGEANHPSPIFRLPFSYFGFGLCAVALGIGRAALDGLKALAAEKVSLATRLGLRDQAHVQYAVAKAGALLRASRNHARESFRPIWQALLDDGPVSMASRAQVRASYVHAAESAMEAVHLCYRAAGGTALFQTSPFEQALRDVYAVTCHATMQRVLMEDAGRVDLGLAPQASFF